MSKRNRAAKAQPDKKVQPRSKQTVVEARADDLAGLTQLPGGLIATAAVGTLQAQAAWLGDARFQTIQRQILAVHIGRVQGNQHLQRVVASLGHNEKRASYQPRVVSRPIQASTAPAHVLQGATSQSAEAASSPRRELSLGERAKKWAFENALSAAGVDKKQVMGLINQAGGAVMEIIEHPGRFVNTLIQALKQGFLQFKANIGKHLKAGLMGWLFGTLSKAGI